MDARERRLVKRLKQQDERAFRELVLTYQGQVYNLVFRMLGNREEAEDLAQEVFITVFKAIGKFRGDSKFSTWLYRVAANHCRNRYKYLARRKQNQMRQLDESVEPGAMHGPQSHVSGPDKVLEGKRLEAAIQQEIAKLDEEQRLLIVLRDIQNLAYQEIAEITGLPTGTVKSRLHRARMTLKNRLARYLNG